MTKTVSIGVKAIFVIAVLLFLPSNALAQCEDRSQGISCKSHVVPFAGPGSGTIERASAQVVKTSSGQIVVVLLTASKDGLGTGKKKVYGKAREDYFMFDAKTKTLDTDPKYVVEETVIVLNSSIPKIKSSRNFLLQLQRGSVEFDLSKLIKDIREVHESVSGIQ